MIKLNLVLILFGVFTCILSSNAAINIRSKGLDPFSHELVRQINSLGTTWKAGNNFIGININHVKRLVGATRSENLTLTVPHKLHDDFDDLPESFDSREAWPNCTSIGMVRDQGNCGSCWAFAPVEAMTDRLCIASNGSIQTTLSALQVIACCTEGDGCHGGDPVSAWRYWSTEGIVSGETYQGGGCLPYPFEPCEHHIVGPKPTCPSTYLSTPQCPATCATNYNKSFEDDKYYGQKPYSLSNSSQIMREIMLHGPVPAHVSVYSDFFSYKSGVYQRTVDDHVGGHALKIIGWGSENDLDYWLALNSWNEDWGDRGYVKIRRGVNECEIESYAIAGLPRL